MAALLSPLPDTGDQRSAVKVSSAKPIPDTGDQRRDVYKRQILDTPKWKTMFRITLPMVKPAILSTILLVFGSAMGSYPVPHYLGLTTLSTKYISMNSKYTGEASILAIRCV